MKRQQGMLLIAFVLGLSACASTEIVDNEALDILAPESELTVASSKIQANDLFVISNSDECYDITPDFIFENSDFQIYKYNNSTESFILYDDTAYSIGTCFGGYGITSMALADLNADGQYELYYTFSWGSGIHRSQIGCFDPVCREVILLDNAFFGADVMLTTNDAGNLCVNKADFDMNSFVDFTIKAKELIGIVAFQNNEIILNTDETFATSNIVYQKILTKNRRTICT